MNTSYKILSNILADRLPTYISKIIGGFQKDRLTTDQIHSIRQILEKIIEYGIDTYNLFIDFRTAYVTINRKKLFQAMLELGIPDMLVKLKKMTLEQVKS